MASLLVPVTDLSREIGPFDETESARAEGFLGEASDLAREIGLATWTEAGGGNPAPVSVRLAVKAAARRAVNEDPDGFSRESLGDWQGSRPSSDTDEVGVYFTAKERATIRAAAGKPSGAYSVRTPSAYRSDDTGLLMLPVGDGGAPIPYLDDGGV